MTTPRSPRPWSAAAIAAGAMLLVACSAHESDEFDLDVYRGKVLVLNFWATWCGPCRFEIPSLVRLRTSFAEGEVAIVGISMDARGTPVQIKRMVDEFVDEYEVNYPIFIDSEFTVARRFDEEVHFGGAIPVTLVFDQKGEIRASHIGVPRNSQGKLDPYSALGDEVQALLDESAAADR